MKEKSVSKVRHTKEFKSEIARLAQMVGQHVSAPVGSGGNEAGN